VELVDLLCSLNAQAIAPQRSRPKLKLREFVSRDYFRPALETNAIVSLRCVNTRDNLKGIQKLTVAQRFAARTRHN
jgi:hypothetical protein